jgi:MFS family permease
MGDRWLTAWAVGSAAHGGASLLLPLYAVELGAGAVELGVLAAVAAFAGVPGPLLVGRVVDRPAVRRAAVLGALGATALVLGFVSGSTALAAVVAANGLLWFSVGTAAPALAVLVVTGTPEGRWSERYARLNAMQGYGWTAGLVAGAVWTAAGVTLTDAPTAQRTFALACGLTALVALGFAWRTLPDPSTRPRRAPDARRLSRAFRGPRLGARGATFPTFGARLGLLARDAHPRRLFERLTRSLAVYLLAVLLFFTGFGAFFAPLPLYLGERGFASGEVFLLYLLSSLGAAAFSRRAGSLAQSHGPFWVHLAGLVLRCVAIPMVAVLGGLLAAGAIGLTALGGLFVAIGVGWALVAITATLLVSRLAPPSVRGTALGVYASLAALGGGVGAMLGGSLAASGYTVAFGAAGLLVGVAALVVLGLRDRVDSHTTDATAGT